ncbi:MAG: hypothetical protein WCF67_20005 [Chitinophagaceae bacterium]
MKSLNPFLLLIACFIVAGMQPCFSQVEITPAIINSTGGSASKNVSLEWSLGEMTTVNMVTSSKLQVSAGVLQGQPWVPVRINEAERPVIFPNPLTKTGYLRYQHAARGTIRCELTDASGKLLRIWTFAHAGGLGTYAINVQDIPAGAFYCITRFTPFAGVSVTNTDVLKIVRQ